jgi:hypothetical protein
MASDTYRSGEWKGLPKRCECGGLMIYARSFDRVFCHCETCTPEVAVVLRRAAPEGTGGTEP